MSLCPGILHSQVVGALIGRIKEVDAAVLKTMRAARFACDRGALLCCQDLHDAVAAIIQTSVAGAANTTRSDEEWLAKATGRDTNHLSGPEDDEGQLLDRLWALTRWAADGGEYAEALASGTPLARTL